MKWIDCETKKINAFNYGVSCVYYLFYSRESNKNVSSDNDNTLIYREKIKKKNIIQFPLRRF